MKKYLTLLWIFFFVCWHSASGATCQDGQRLFAHKLLATEPVCIPKNARRIVAMDMGAVELTLLSGRELLGSSHWLLSEMSVLMPEFSDALPKIENVGYPVNLEKLLALQPDLILAVGGADGINGSIDFAKAQKIAPTVMANPLVYDSWQNSSEFWAQALGEQDLYARLLKNYQTRVAEVQKNLGAHISERVSIIANSNYGKSLWLENTPPSSVVADIGLARPASQTPRKNAKDNSYIGSRYRVISEERLDMADGDAIFVFGYPSGDKKGQKTEKQVTKKLKNNPLWKTLKAVRANKAFYVGGHWWRCNSYILANRVLDDIAENLTGKLPTTPALKYPLEQPK